MSSSSWLMLFYDEVISQNNGSGMTSHTTTRRGSQNQLRKAFKKPHMKPNDCSAMRGNDRTALQ